MRVVKLRQIRFSFFFFNDTATTEIYTLSLHDALPIWITRVSCPICGSRVPYKKGTTRRASAKRSEEHTSELQSRLHLVCRLLLEKKKSSPSRSTSAVSRSR